MFDIFGVANFGENKNLDNLEDCFLRNDYYKDLKFNDYHYVSDISRIYILEKGKRLDNVCITSSTQLFLFGTCFSTKHYCQDFSAIPEKLAAKDVSDLYNKYKDGLTKYIKGMFTIVIIDTKKSQVKLISDRTNLLPLFYYFKNNVLIFSSSLNAVIEAGITSNNINKRSLVKLAIFNYIPGNETLITDVFMQSYASIIKVEKNTLTEKHYWDIADIFTASENRLKKEESLVKCNSFIKDCVNMYVADQKYFAVTLTGGYDSRVIFAVLEREQNDYFCYSYGMDGCFDIKLPQQICRDIGVDFRRFLLDRNFESNFDEYACKAVYHSDGLGSITKANVVYPCEMITNSVDVVLTGLFGSEIIKQPISVSHYVNYQVRNLFFSSSAHLVYNRLLEDEKNKQYLSRNLLSKYGNEIFDEMNDTYQFRKSDKYAFYSFIFKEGMRKYFMQQLKIERVYIENRHPFLDDELITLIFKTPFAGIYNIKKNKNIAKAWKPHLLYAYIMNQNRPNLSAYITTHGYKPHDILSYPRMIKALLDYYLNKNTIKNAKTFDYEKWVHAFCGKHLKDRTFRDGLLGSIIRQKYESDEHRKNIGEFSKYLSLQIWLQFHEL